MTNKLMKTNRLEQTEMKQQSSTAHTYRSFALMDEERNHLYIGKMQTNSFILNKFQIRNFQNANFYRI